MLAKPGAIGLGDAGLETGAYGLNILNKIPKGGRLGAILAGLTGGKTMGQKCGSLVPWIRGPSVRRGHTRTRDHGTRSYRLFKSKNPQAWRIIPYRRKLRQRRGGTRRSNGQFSIGSPKIQPNQVWHGDASHDGSRLCTRGRIKIRKRSRS